MEKTNQINLGPVNHIEVGQGRCYVINGHDIGVFRTRQGNIFAIENRCPHRGGPLSDGVVGDGRVVCPLHGHKFDLKTGKGSEEHECVHAFPVSEKNGEIILEYPVSLLCVSAEKK